MHFKKRKELMKKKIWIIILLPFVITLITLRIISYDKPKSNLSGDKNANSLEIDRLFRDMGVLKVPHIAPPVDFSLLDLNGNKVSLSDFKGKIVFLNFWTTWCPGCRIEMPAMEKLHKRLKDKDFAMVSINIQEPASVIKKLFKDYKLTFTALLDSKGELSDPFGIRAIPTTFILNKDGGMIGKALGPREWNNKESIALFERLMDESDSRV